MAEFKISRFRYTWRGNWSASSVEYIKDDVIYYRGSAWVCIRAHTSDVFNSAQTYIPAGNTNPSPGWVKMSEGRQFLGDWTNGIRYDPGVLVYSGGNAYLCLSSHESSANFNSDLSNWEIFAVGSNFRNNWTAATRYRVGDVIRYNSYTYQCVLEHTSGSVSQGVIVGNNDGNDDSTAETWAVKVENYSYVGPYATLTRYRINDLVKYGGSILKCITEHTSSATPGFIVSANFVTYLSGFEYDNQWNSASYYAIGDIVTLGGILYTASENNYNSQPGITETNDFGGAGNPAWTVINKGINFTGEYDPQSGRDYFQGDVVRRGGALWISLTNQYTDDSTLRPLDTSNWQLVIAAQNFRSAWNANQDYNLYDAVYYRGVVYYANTPHQSSFENFPGDNGEGVDYWTTLLVGNQDAALTQYGDMLTYNLKRNVLEDGSTTFTLGDGSTIGPAPITIGTKDQLLVVENNLGDIGYTTWGNNPRAYYVRQNGVDDLTDLDRGTNYFKPWRTVAFALSQVDDGYSGFTSILVSTGLYDEVLPLIVPARTAIVGEELRSVTIRAKAADSVLAAAAENIYLTLVYVGTILSAIVQKNPVIPTPGNTVSQSFGEISSTSGSAALVNTLWGNILTMISYLVDDFGASPVITGNNTLTTDSQRLSTVTLLELNRSFIKEEFQIYLAVTYPTTIIDTELLDNYIDNFINAMQYDLRYPGNYKSVLAGRRYANAIIGSQLEDMFYVRDSTGIRNMTLRGLEGTLPAAVEGEVYQIPTGGAFVSLDPGWGPADTRVWIINRSCYIQNVTTFGTGAVGQKVDGSLHNGGNKSIVSNDFTQVISDGIGAWMINGGRGELVSVFSYYAHIGMFAKNGGIIRATNGNSSYGDFGAVADGIDSSETVRYGIVNTQLTDAVIDSAFAGEINDYILGLEFSHCGENYTTASYSFQSSGSGAVAVQEEFRDNAMFEMQVLSPGSGFEVRGNQAITGNTTSITLATAENATAEEIIGKRIIIISGEGTGQYGYVQAYNPSTKLCTVYRESDDQPGWDHINPGTPSRDTMTTGTRYRIEPRPIFSEPPYTAEVVTLATANSWAAAVYGETSEVFTAVTGGAGTGTVVEVTPANAVFTVTKTGRTYSATITSGGAGYAVGDNIVIDGADIGGISNEHDLTITVIDISDDSTNSVLAFTISDTTPIAASGKFVIVPNTGHFGRYSSNGETWTSFDLPTDGNWRCLVAGDNKFVAIANGSSNSAYSSNGVDWTASSGLSSRNWNSVAYGKPPGVSTGVFVAVAGNLNSAAYSTNGTTWTASSMPVFGDSTLNEWVDITFGYGKFVAIANSGNIAAVGTWNGTTLTWQGTIMDVVADSSAKDWISVAYGNRRFVAISSTGDAAYSFNGLEWTADIMPSQDGSTTHNWQQIRYGQGVFFAVGNTGGRTVGADPTVGPTTYAATSYDGIVWTERTMPSSQNWGVIAFGNPDITLGDSTISNNKPTWIAAPTDATTDLARIYTGARILGRCSVEGIGISRIKIWEPGSGYVSDPTVSITDPNKIADPIFRPRLGDGVLTQPTFTSTGSAYKTSTTTVTVTGDGFADVTPTGRYITIDDLTVMPGPGAQFYIGGKPTIYVAVLTGIDETIQPNGLIRSTFQLSPRPSLTDIIEHGMEVLIREQYSQVRITGHDFLDIGTGGFVETNYPVLYQDYDYTPFPDQEVKNLNGGRVFYTSTDQSGNFRAGEQFAVEQSTGIITISADFFDLSGLTELRLAGINVGSTAVIREFSKDPLFLQNSNNVIPTQRAVRSYLQSRLNIGGEDLLTPSIIAGTVKVGPGEISNTAGIGINVNVLADFSGVGAGLSHGYIAQTMFFRSFE
jgi:hypothetical protein